MEQPGKASDARGEREALVQGLDAAIIDFHRICEDIARHARECLRKGSFPGRPRPEEDAAWRIDEPRSKAS